MTEQNREQCSVLTQWKLKLFSGKNIVFLMHNKALYSLIIKKHLLQIPSSHRGILQERFGSIKKNLLYLPKINTAEKKLLWLHCCAFHSLSQLKKIFTLLYKISFTYMLLPASLTFFWTNQKWYYIHLGPYSHKIKYNRIKDFIYNLPTTVNFLNYVTDKNDSQWNFHFMLSNLWFYGVGPYIEPWFQ